MKRADVQKINANAHQRFIFAQKYIHLKSCIPFIALQSCTVLFLSHKIPIKDENLGLGWRK